MTAIHKILITVSVLLFISLAGNMFFLGIWLGSSVQQSVTETTHITPAVHSASEIKQIDREFSALLPAQDKEIIRNRMKESRGTLREQKEALDIAQRAVRNAMYADPFDQAALDQALADERTARQSLHAALNTTRRNMAADLSPEGRRALAKMEDRLSRYRDARNNGMHDDAANGERGKEMRRFEKLRKLREHRKHQDGTE
ncbi:MAG: periplasmic heavy metal sensor [Alphaproteobacteria bacterium]|nr:MAG: periplasmic heavy metal sensor [Alphaproteobacteria bacterium]